MKRFIINIFSCLLLTSISFNQISRHENVTLITTNALTTTNNDPNIEGLKQTTDKSQSELLKFIPKNYSILDSVTGDLNLDKINDYILVLKKNGENDTTRRPLLILIRDKNNKLKLVRRNDNTVYCIDCGGIMGDPFMGITLKNGYFSVEHYGGSAWRWTRIVTYKYFRQDNEWFLHKDGTESFHVSEPEKVERTIKTKKDFGKVTFEQFDIYKDDE